MPGAKAVPSCFSLTAQPKRVLAISDAANCIVFASDSESVPAFQDNALFAFVVENEENFERVRT